MKIHKILSISISLTYLISGSVFGATIKVPDDYPTIQQAIDAAVDGDTVLVGPDISETSETIHNEYDILPDAAQKSVLNLTQDLIAEKLVTQISK